MNTKTKDPTRLYNGGLAERASLKEVTRSIEWFAETLKKFKESSINLVPKFENLKAQLEAHRANRIGKNK